MSFYVLSNNIICNIKNFTFNMKHFAFVVLLILTISVNAQSLPDTLSSICKQVSYNKIEQSATNEVNNEKSYYCNAMIGFKRSYKYYYLRIGKKIIYLFKIRTKCEMIYP